jgi:hypothetical protein
MHYEEEFGFKVNILYKLSWYLAQEQLFCKR